MARFSPGSCAMLALATALVAGCATRHPAPVHERTAPSASVPAKPPAARAPTAPSARPQVHVVRKGDTLYSIALEYNIEPRELAAWNSAEDGRIRIGQQLTLVPPTVGVTTAPLKSAPAQVEARPLGGRATLETGNVKSEPVGARVPYSEQAYGQMAAIKPQAPAEPRPPARPEGERGDDDLGWIWPANGKVISGFNEGANLKGIAIAGKLGQPVLASAPGRVIFSGTGIRGFGKLIVIKHNETFLSVYAHNSTLLVKEQQTVTKGQKIAEMGNSDTDQVKLHFEIRRLGKPVDPSKLLPDRPG